MELPRSLLRSPLPPAPSAAPQEGRGATPHIVRFPIIIEYVGTDHQKEIYWERWKPYFRWDPSIDEAIVRAAYDVKACVRYGALMHELRALSVRPDFVTDESWNRYREYWASADFKARFEKALHNRKNEKGSPGTGPSKHTCGTRSFRTYEDILALDKDEDDERSFMREKHTQATPDQPINKEQLYYDAAGNCPKGRVYGLGSLVRKKRRYVESMVRHSEFDAVVQRLSHFEAFVLSQLGMRMDFGANTSQAPPPPPPQEHHEQVGMDPACSPQQHDDDNRDSPNWVDEEHLGDES
ncbi:hypothetical protein Scep_013003 [Stephania cephalantha]|uniref:Uncharacterized protein n=1 Tax=Stephania cephalantha TaxID=152367 RepID=A0AAP0JH07_9MAGN